MRAACNELSLFKFKTLISLLVLMFILSVVEARVYYEGYFNQLGLKWSQVPMSWQDIFSNAIYWFPVPIIIFAFIQCSRKFNRLLFIVPLILYFTVPYVVGKNLAINANHRETKATLLLENDQKGLEIKSIGIFNRFLLAKSKENDLEIIPIQHVTAIKIQIPLSTQ